MILNMGTILALLVATLIPGIYLLFMTTRDLYQTGSRRIIIICFVWGMLAYFMATKVNPLMVNYGGLSWEQVVRFGAPVAEEILKGAILVYLIRRADFTYFVDGAIYGFTIGIGFAVIENFEYVLNSNVALILALQRVLSTNLVHATASGAIGVALGNTRFSHSIRQFLFLIIGMLTAMGLHSLFNNLVTGKSPLLVAILIGFGGAALIFAIIRRGLAEEKVWIEQSLGARDRVTAGEAAIVQRLENLEDIMEPLIQRFGAEKASQAERFLLVQAKIGIKRKSLENFQKMNDERMIKAIEAELVDLRTQMDEARRAVGAYCMLYLRNIYPENNGQMWSRLQSIVEQRAAPKEQAGKGLWTSLNKKLDDVTRKEEKNE